jgi:hypothetical protein
MRVSPGLSGALLAALMERTDPAPVEQSEEIGAAGMSSGKARTDRSPIAPGLWYAAKTRRAGLESVMLEERSESARKAAKARWDKKRREEESS